MKTGQQFNFAHAEAGSELPKTRFPMKTSVKTTFNSSELTPLRCIEVLPGDVFDINSRALVHLATPIKPTMDDLVLDVYAFWVPNRIVWDGFERLMGENVSGPWAESSQPPTVPRFYSGTDLIYVGENSLGDYYGLPPSHGIRPADISALPFRGYAVIYNRWFRDQNFQAPIPLYTGDGADIDQGIPPSLGSYSPKSPPIWVNKRHDMFTSCLPSPQKGTSVLLPLFGLAPVTTYNNPGGVSPGPALTWSSSVTGLPFGNIAALGVNPSQQTTVNGTPGPATGVTLMPNNLQVDLSLAANNPTISDLRTAFQIQKALERDARTGTRFIEQLYARFGVWAEDFRVQQPEFLGQATSYIQMSQVAQTSSTDTSSPQGNLSAYSVTPLKGNITKKAFVEHGYIHIFAAVRSFQSYEDGIERHFSRQTRWDYYSPERAHISEQPIRLSEIFVTGTEYDSAAWGYNEPWAQYRFLTNLTTAGMRVKSSNSWGIWHYGTAFASEPALSDGFIRDNTKINVDRTIALPTTMAGNFQFFGTFLFDIEAERVMPVYSIPGLIDHF